MKEGGESVNPGKRTSGSGSGGVRSESEKEKTKMRERQRRGITTNIFHGLRKHGGYRLTPRADINEVLRHLAKEAGWIIEPDGTTYRSTPSLSILNRCPLCGTARSSTPTPTSSVVNGEISLTAEVGNNGDIPFGLYVYGNHEGGGAHVCNSNEEVVAYGHLQEPRPSNQPVASPIPRT